ncbi:serine/threonine protein kinase [Ktedonospora formicarum]|uniref:non-specific serine/threonine protein kinase n=1 Tax=Ktedonospora formicarum TaxID=2778364 RepID=A0A8J3HWQ9_9CHLR|nr:serine/threonine-protein kinase [Ktedonospora formicarum]GHO44646.1 hypothetical protein KSX_28090 [Ktedonospora formicarum]
MNNYSEVPVEQRQLIGQQLGNYRLVRLLGQGGFADVYLGEHIHLQTHAAIKVLRLTLTAENMESFRKEAQVIARLEHPHIIRILDYGVEHGLPYLVMSYAAHGAISRHYPRGTRIPLPTLIRLLKQTAGALHYAHGQRLIHRDIKPENILLNQNDEVLLSDFGIALVAQTSRQTTLDVVGTATYMAPEQLMGKPSPASDQYSLAIVAYEWLMGNPPFSGSFPEVCAQQLNAPAIDRTRNNAHLMPEPIAQVLEKALAKDAQQRFPDVLAFVNAFEQAAQSSTHTSTENVEPTKLRLPAQPHAPLSHQNGDTIGYQSEGLTEKTPALTPPINTAGPRMLLPSRSVHSERPINVSPQQNGSQTPSYNINYVPVGQASTGRSWHTNDGYRLPSNLTPKRLILIGGLILLIIILLISIFPLGKGTSQTSSQKTPVATSTAKTTTTKPSPGSILYQANWSQGADGWDLKGGWHTMNGKIGIDREDARSDMDIFAPFQPAIASYIVETQLTFNGFGGPGGKDEDKHKGGPADGDDYGVIVRFSDGGGYACGLDRNAGAYIASLHDNHLQTRLTNVGYSFASGSHTFRVKVQKSEITLIIDGQPIAHTNSDTHMTPGLVGLRSNNAIIEATNFKIIAL